MSNAIKVGDKVVRTDELSRRFDQLGRPVRTVVKVGRKTAKLDGGTIVLLAELELAEVLDTYPTNGTPADQGGWAVRRHGR